MLSKCEYSEGFEFEIAPISSYLFKIISKCIHSKLFNKSYSFESDIQDIKRILELWNIQKDNQSKLFAEIDCQLWELIKKNFKYKPTLLQFYKDLTGPANCLPEKMRQYPKILEISESKEKIEKELTILSPKGSKAKFNSNPKIKTNKQKSKKISSLNQNLGTSAKNEKIKKEEVLYPIDVTSVETNKLDCPKVVHEQDINGLNQRYLFEEIPFKFDMRVQRWDDHPFGEPFLEIDFPEYYDKALSYQKLMHLFHAPHKLIDRFLCFGIEGSWLNSKNHKNDLRYVIPAEITYENQTHRGLMVYAIDRETNVCYHRFFTEKMDQDILYQITNKVFNENDYPDLRDAVNLGQSPLSKVNVVDSSSIKIESGHVEIIDFEREVKIKLFKVKSM
jgi:hypothetical protein